MIIVIHENHGRDKGSAPCCHDGTPARVEDGGGESGEGSRLGPRTIGSLSRDSQNPVM